MSRNHEITRPESLLDLAGSDKNKRLRFFLNGYLRDAIKKEGRYTQLGLARKLFNVNMVTAKQLYNRGIFSFNKILLRQYGALLKFHFTEIRFHQPRRVALKPEHPDGYP